MDEHREPGRSLDERAGAAASARLDRHNVAARFVDAIRLAADVVDDSADIVAVTRDAGDDYLVALARLNAADYIVTGDKDLLEWSDQQPPVVSPEAFERLLAG